MHYYYNLNTEVTIFYNGIAIEFPDCYPDSKANNAILRNCETWYQIASEKLANDDKFILNERELTNHYQDDKNVLIAEP